MYKGINALCWPSIINCPLLPPRRLSVLYWPSTQLHHLVTHSWANSIDFFFLLGLFSVSIHKVVFLILLAIRRCSYRLYARATNCQFPSHFVIHKWLDQLLFEVTRVVVFSVQEQQEEYFQLLQRCARRLLKIFPVLGSPGMEDSFRGLVHAVCKLRELNQHQEDVADQFTLSVHS